MSASSESSGTGGIPSGACLWLARHDPEDCATPWIRHVIFDLDGTLFDTAPDIAVALRSALSSSFGTPSPYPLPQGGEGKQRPRHEQATQQAIGRGLPLHEMIRAAVGQEVSADALERIAADFRRHYDASDFSGTQAYPGILELLERLSKSGRGLHIATNKREQPTRRLLECKGVLGLFSEIACVDSAAAKWSKKQMLERIMKATNASARECVILGDSVSDIAAGRELGMRTVGILYGYGERQAIVEARPDMICERADLLLSGVEANSPV